MFARLDHPEQLTSDAEVYAAPNHLREASRQELIGAIMVRAQVVEEIMREMIAEVAEGHSDARSILPGKPFGPVKDLFKKTFKNDERLFSCLSSAGIDRVLFFELLDSVNTARNEAAHSHYLVAVWLEDVMEDYPDKRALARFVTKGIRKDAEGIDWLLDLIITLRFNLFHEHRLFFDSGQLNPPNMTSSTGRDDGS